MLALLIHKSKGDIFGALQLLKEDFVTPQDIQDLLSFWNELSTPYEEKQRLERESVNKAVSEFDIIEQLDTQDLNINPEEWNF